MFDEEPNKLTLSRDELCRGTTHFYSENQLPQIHITCIRENIGFQTGHQLIIKRRHDSELILTNCLPRHFSKQRSLWVAHRQLSSHQHLITF